MDMEIKNEVDLRKLIEDNVDRFNLYANMLVEWNEKINLTAITDIDEIFEKHFYDSIRPSLDTRLFNDSISICDVGAGAGFPSIPLKIVYPNISVTIIEPLGKRCKFLEELVNQLKLDNVTIINGRAEDVVKEKRESFDLVTARAVANLNILSELCIPLVKINGTFLSLKGEKGNEELDSAKDAIKILGGKVNNVFEIESDYKRVNIEIIKIKNTPLKYPRNYGKIKKQPLGVK